MGKFTFTQTEIPGVVVIEHVSTAKIAAWPSSRLSRMLTAPTVNV